MLRNVKYFIVFSLVQCQLCNLRIFFDYRNSNRFKTVAHLFQSVRRGSRLSHKLGLILLSETWKSPKLNFLNHINWSQTSFFECSNATLNIHRKKLIFHIYLKDKNSLNELLKTSDTSCLVLALILITVLQSSSQTVLQRRRKEKS